MTEALPDSTKDRGSLTLEAKGLAHFDNLPTASIPPSSIAPSTNLSKAASTAQTAAPPGTTLSTPPPDSAASDAGSDVGRDNSRAETRLSNEDRLSSEGSSKASTDDIQSNPSQKELPDGSKMLHKQRPIDPLVEQLWRAQVDQALLTLKESTSPKNHEGWIFLQQVYQKIRGIVASEEGTEWEKLRDDLHCEPYRRQPITQPSHSVRSIFQI